MYRSQEIIQIFSQVCLPKDVTQYILNIERKLIYKKSIYQWIRLSKLFHSELSKRFFHEDLLKTFLNEIREINGNTKYLQKYKLKLYKINQENKICSIYLNSLRF
tara:strand:+ start:263 stop:577 length:315 start_codon:yes stop_codon:yes gene_type:complete